MNGTRVSPFSLDGKTVVVTGALGGIGSAIVAGLLAAGANVVLSDLSAHENEALRGHGDDAVPRVLTADVTDWASVKGMLNQVVDEFGRVDVVVNNAGLMTRQSFLETSLADWNRTIAVDLTGVFIVSRLAAPLMLASGGGAIINMASQLAFKGAHDYVSYCAAKAGVVGLTRAMARELGPSIRVNAIAPGPILTPLTEPYATDDWVQERTRDLISRRLGFAHEVAPAVVFLASDAAALLHGQTLHVNGGGYLA